MKRGDIWTAAGGAGYAGKPRPVLIVQEDSFAATESITVCLLTTTLIEADIGRQIIEPGPENGLRETSYVMIDKVTTIPRTRLGKRLGALKPTAMAPINQAILVFLGLAGSARG